jgi:hypothetical protein
MTNDHHSIDPEVAATCIKFRELSKNFHTCLKENMSEVLMAYHHQLCYLPLDHYISCA